MAMLETLNRIQVTEVSPERKATFIEHDPDTVYGVFCSDDRNPTPESVKKLQSEYGIDGNVYIRVFGGSAGIARRLAVAIALQHGSDELSKYGESFADFEKAATYRIERSSKVKLGLHSAEDNEKSLTDLNHDSEQALGCAYCNGIGAITCLCEPGSSLTSLAISEHRELFGNENLVDHISKANEIVHGLFFPNNEKFSLTRKDVSGFGLPIMICGGSHAPAEDIEVVVNLDPTKLSQPGVANKSGYPFYCVDAAIEAGMEVKAFPELELDPKLLIAIIIDDARAVREALASHEGLHAEAMKLTIHGNIEESLKYLG